MKKLDSLSFKTGLFASTALIITLAFQACSVGFQASDIDGLAGQLSSFDKSFQCNPSSEPSPTFNQRLTKFEYRNTIIDLLSVLDASSRAQVPALLDEYLAIMPEDDAQQKFKRNTNSISQELVQAYVYSGTAISEFLAADINRLRALVGSCAQLTDLSDSCFNSFVSGPAERIYRRPLSGEDIASLRQSLDAYTGNKTQWLIAQMLSSPNFFMHIENVKKEISPGLYEITDFALANRLSYYLTASMPDAQLFQAAKEGKLSDELELYSQVQRLSNGDGIKHLMETFYDEWLDLDHIEVPNETLDAGMIALAAGDSLTEESLRQEIVDMLNYYTFEVDGKISDLLTSDISFAKGEDLAKVYGVQPWNGSTNNLVRMPAGERSGLLTRAAFLVNNGSLTSPIHRGIKIRNEFLCDPLPPPPPEIANLDRAPEFDFHLTTRERTINKTSDSTCIGCHRKINPLGFVMESFDSFGRFRTRERIFDSESGDLLNELPIEHSIAPLISLSDSTVVSSPVEFNKMLANEGHAERCIVQNFYYYAYRKFPDMEKDGCAMEEMRQNANENGGSLKTMVLSIPLSESFRQKKIADSQ